ncbi:membrane-associated oxidoreductase [Streptomyces ipomoeae]|uniref:membrane-associated oxidoreductase n=1 Tax=Streptomyces ipomoeae TaxID=103232 RepID=UPI00114619E9|nr:membrane-associated oxidoreductase [Streptomyces ipomoeae]MDX2933361.1 membrane-associated oxidoreductase [Streptomyces ipomoeae]TQE20357.1 membrane-associated oxidoreductase [Streptomyces ipomoeae]
MIIDELTAAERRVWEAFPRGVAVDFRTSDDEEATDGEAWGPERTVRASVLRALLLTVPQEEGEVAALKISGARITGALDLRYATADCVIRMSHCHFDAVPDWSGAQLHYVKLNKSVFPGLRSARIRVDGSLRMTECRFRGPLRLGGAQIAGALYLQRAEFTGAEDGEPVLQLNQAEIGDDLCAPGLRAQGEIRLNDATVNGMIDLMHADLHHRGGTVLRAERLSASSDVLMRHARAHGRIDLRGARIEGRLEMSYARLSNPGGTVLRVSSGTVSELWLRRGPRIEGVLNLRRSQIEVLFLEPDILPDKVLLNHLTYTTLLPHEPAVQRLPMVERDGDGYVPYAYEQLTEAYRRIGDDAAARRVQLAKQRRHRATLAWYGRLWGYVQDATVGYGFRPLRAAVWLLSLMAVGSIAYALHRPAPLKADEAPQFNPVFFTLDLLLPIIDFGQERAYAPEGWAQWLSYVLVITGWILATTVVTGVTRTVSRQ